tara:strand:+ start:2398 stop:3165 length:768 start_codon:yes stop_codon:yes gene_type:complete
MRIQWQKARKLYNLEETRQLWSGFTAQTKEFFEKLNPGMIVDNHKQHTIDPEYQEYILGPIKDDPEHWRGKTALDFGCGCGRNIKNLLDAAPFGRVDGCDISRLNAEYSKKHVLEHFDKDKCETWESDGFGILPTPDDEYDFVMSHVVFQHIANYSIRYHILEDIYRGLRAGGLVSLHFMDLGGTYEEYYGHYPPPTAAPAILENPSNWEVRNCMVRDENYLIKDFEEIGFKDVVCHTGRDLYCHQKSYYVWGRK